MTSAYVSVNGTTGSRKGTVVRVGPVDTSDSSYDYPIVVSLPDGTSGLPNGAGAQIEVVLHDIASTLAVPTSAVTTTAAGSYVTELANGQEQRRRVKVGVVGGTHTQILSGITKGTTVVLADLSEAVPTSSTNSTTGGFGGFGGFGGAGFGGAGGARFRISGSGGFGGG